MSRCLSDLLVVRAEHIEGLARMAVELARAEPADLGADRADTAAPLLRPVLALGNDLDGRRPAEVLRDYLCRQLASTDRSVMAAAASLIAALGFNDRQTCRALAEAQDHDASELGWPVVRALLATVPTDASPAAVADAPLVAEELSAGTRESLRATTPHPPEPGRRRSPRSGLAGSAVPMRGVAGEPTVRARLLGDVRLTRMALCLYGGLPFADSRRLQAERERLVTMRDAEAEAWDVRWQAAVHLDTVLDPALAGLGAAVDLALDPRWMAVDSPLTERLSAALRSGAPVEEIVRSLQDVIADGSETDEARGDALAALVAMGVLDPMGWARTLPSGGRSGIEARVRWRLERALLISDDALRRVHVQRLLQVPEARHRPPVGISGGPILRTIAAHPHDGLNWPMFVEPNDLVELLLNVVRLPLGDDRQFSAAVAVDTCGKALTRSGGTPLIRCLANRDDHMAVVGPLLRDVWPEGALTPREVDVLGEAMTTIAGFTGPWTWLRLWCIDRLVDRIIEGGYALEALVLTARAAVDLPAVAAATTGRLLAAVGDRVGRDLVGSGGVGDGVGASWLTPETVALLQESAVNPYVRARADLLLWVITGRRLDDSELGVLVAHVSSPAAQLRLLELAWDNEVCPTTAEGIARARHLASACTPVEERFRARARLLRRAPEEHDLEDEMVADAADIDGGLVAATIAHLASDGLLSESAVERLASGLALPEHRALARGGLGGPVLALEAGLVGGAATTGEGPDEALVIDWAVMSLTALCRDGLGRRFRASTQAAAWDGLIDPQTRGPALETLIRAAERRLLPLGPPAMAAIGALAAEGSPGSLWTVAEVLGASTMAAPSPAIERWRNLPDERVRDRATLLAVENGLLDRAAVGALVRLLCDPDDRVQMRVTTAICSRARGGLESPRFRCSVVGPDVVVELARVAHAGVPGHPIVETVLMWALSDLVVDSVDVLRRALDEVADDREVRSYLLRQIRQVRAETLEDFMALVEAMPEADAADLLRSFTAIASHPTRSGVEVRALRTLRPRLVRLLEEADPLAAARAAGVLAELGPDPAVVDALLGLADIDDVESVSLTASVLSALGRIASLSDRELDDATRKQILHALTRALTSSSEVLAGHAVHALAIAGHNVEPLVDQVPHRVVLRGLVDLSGHHVINAAWDRAIERAANFVRRPPGLSGAEADDCTADLIAVLLEWIRVGSDDLASASASARTGDGSGVALQDVLPILAELSTRMPAAMRMAVASQAPDLCARLAGVARGTFGWTARTGAVVALMVLGDGSGEIIATLLELSTDDEAVHSAITTSLDQMDRIAADGLAELVAAVDHPCRRRAVLAVELMATLFEQRALDDHQRGQVLDAVERACARPDASRALVAARGGQLHNLATLGRHGSAALLRMSGRSIPIGSPARRDRWSTFSLTMPDSTGQAVTMTVLDEANLGGDNTLSSQLALLGSVGRTTDSRITNAVRDVVRRSSAVGLRPSAVVGAVVATYSADSEPSVSVSSASPMA